MPDEAAQAEQPAAPAPESPEAALEAAMAAEKPAPSFDPESFKSNLTGEMRKEFEGLLDKRVKGFQQKLAEKDREIQRLSRGSSDDEPGEDDAAAELAQLRRKTWILERRADNAAVADVLLKFSEAPDAEAQFQVLADFAASLTPPPAEPKAEPEAEEGVPAVDLNNPLPGAGEDVTVTSSGTTLTKAIEERFLKSLTAWPGRG